MKSTRLSTHSAVRSLKYMNTAPRTRNLIALTMALISLAAFAAWRFSPVTSAQSQTTYNARDEFALTQGGTNEDNLLFADQSFQSRVIKESGQAPKAMMACVPAPSGLFAWYRGENNAIEAYKEFSP